MATKTKRKPKVRTAGKTRGGGRKARKPARSGKSKTKKPKTKARPARAKATPKSQPGRARAPRKRGPAKVSLETGTLSPRVTAVLKAAAWVAAHGRFVWHDLVTTDAAAARGFYGELFGWRMEELNMGGSLVLLLKNGDRSIGTIMAEASLPHSLWMPYLAVGDVDAACRRVSELGGQVCVEATSLPRLGRFAVVNDPQGGTFSPLRRPSDAAPPIDPSRASPGDFCWEELLTTDPESAARFYGEILGWNVESVSEDGGYWTARSGGVDVAGIARQPPHAAQRPFWRPYVAVADIDASAARAAALGATILTPPTDIPEAGRFAVLVNPLGASLALYRGA